MSATDIYRCPLSCVNVTLFETNTNPNRWTGPTSGTISFCAGAFAANYVFCPRAWKYNSTYTFQVAHMDDFAKAYYANALAVHDAHCNSNAPLNTCGNCAAPLKTYACSRACVAHAAADRVRVCARASKKQVCVRLRLPAVLQHDLDYPGARVLQCVHQRREQLRADADVHHRQQHGHGDRRRRRRQVLHRDGGDRPAAWMDGRRGGAGRGSAGSRGHAGINTKAINTKAVLGPLTFTNSQPRVCAAFVCPPLCMLFVHPCLTRRNLTSDQRTA